MISKFRIEHNRQVTFVDNISVDKIRFIIFLSLYDKISAIPLALKSSYAIGEH